MDGNEENLYEILLRNLEEAVVFADSKGRIQIFNPVAEAYFEVRTKEALGKRYDRVIPFKNIRKHFEAVYEKKERDSDVELAIRVPSSSGNGKTHILRCSFSPIFDKKGTFLGCLGTFADVTEKGLLSREISKSRDL